MSNQKMVIGKQPIEQPCHLRQKRNSLARHSAECVLLGLELLVSLHGEPPGMEMCEWVSETRKESIFLV